MTKVCIKEKAIREHIERRSKEDNSRYGYIADYYNNSGDHNLTSINKKYLINVFYGKNYEGLMESTRITGISDGDFSKEIKQLKDKMSLLIEHDSALIKEYTKVSR